jgi:hypothetical protein
VGALVVFRFNSNTLNPVLIILSTIFDLLLIIFWSELCLQCNISWLAVYASATDKSIIALSLEIQDSLLHSYNSNCDRYLCSCTYLYRKSVCMHDSRVKGINSQLTIVYGV